MGSELDGYLRRAIERLATEVEDLGRRQKAFEVLAERILAEQAELRREQAELRRRQEAQSQEWQDFGRRWRTYSADWQAHLDRQIQQLEHFAQQLIALLPPEASEE